MAVVTQVFTREQFLLGCHIESYQGTSLKRPLTFSWRVNKGHKRKASSFDNRHQQNEQQQLKTETPQDSNVSTLNLFIHRQIFFFYFATAARIILPALCDHLEETFSLKYVLQRSF